MTEPAHPKLVTKCPGKTRIPLNRAWYVKHGETPQQATYCSVCVTEGCAGCSFDAVSLFQGPNVNCDCPNPALHKEANLKIEPLKCQKCAKRWFKYATIDCCRSCGQPNIDMADKLCGFCSSLLERCYGCGKRKFDFPYLVKLLDLSFPIYRALVWACCMNETCLT